MTTVTTSNSNSERRAVVVPSMAGQWQMERTRLAELVARVNGAGPSAFAGVGAPPASGRGYSLEGDVAVVPLVGIMTAVPSEFDGWLGLAPATTTVKALRAAAADPAAKAIRLDIDSPGGMASAGAAVSAAVREAGGRKMVLARVGGIGASAAYRAASQAYHVEASPDSLVGGIGTYTVLVDDTAFQDRIGVRLTLVTTGGIKGAGADGRVTPELVADTERVIRSLNDLFIADVAAGRKIGEAQARQLADGRVYVGREAKALRLIDKVTGDAPPSSAPGTSDPKAQAAAEWAGGRVDRSRWVSRDTFIAYRAAELAGRVRVSKSDGAPAARVVVAGARA